MSGLKSEHSTLSLIKGYWTSSRIDGNIGRITGAWEEAPVPVTSPIYHNKFLNEVDNPIISYYTYYILDTYRALFSLILRMESPKKETLWQLRHLCRSSFDCLLFLYGCLRKQLLGYSNGSISQPWQCSCCPSIYKATPFSSSSILVSFEQISYSVIG